MGEASNQAYIDILEKTNQQLSLWANPYSLMILVLTILIAFMAIALSFIIWKQGQDYKKALAESLKKQESHMNDKLSKVLDYWVDVFSKKSEEIYGIKEELETKSQELKDKSIPEVKKAGLKEQIKELIEREKLIKETYHEKISAIVKETEIH